MNVSVQCLAPVRLPVLTVAERAVIKNIPSIVTRVFKSTPSPRHAFGRGPRSPAKSLDRRLRHTGMTPVMEVSILIVGRARMRKLHRDFMDDPTDTDVLAFPTDLGGDIAICAPVAAANAKRFDEPVARELLRLIVHGSLHLLGYQDEPRSAQKKMWVQQEKLVESLWTY